MLLSAIFEPRSEAFDSPTVRRHVQYRTPPPGIGSSYGMATRVFEPLAGCVASPCPIAPPRGHCAFQNYQNHYGFAILPHFAAADLQVAGQLPARQDSWRRRQPPERRPQRGPQARLPAFQANRPTTQRFVQFARPIENRGRPAATRLPTGPRSPGRGVRYRQRGPFRGRRDEGARTPSATGKFKII